MTVSFGTISNTVRVPLAYVEFDNSLAVSGTPAKNNKMLIMGLKLASGSAPANTPVRITRASQAEQLYGRGSMLAQMLTYFINANANADLYAIGVNDATSPVYATGKLTITGTATAAGQIALMIAGTYIPVTCYQNDTADTIAQNMTAKINANETLPVTSTCLSGEIALTCKWGGITGNDIDVRLNYYDGELLPSGVGCTITAMNGGVGNPDLSDVLTVLGDDTWWSDIVNPFTDTANLDLLATELTDRWGGIRQIDGTCWMAYRGTHAQSSTFAIKRNDHLFTCIPTNIAPEPPYLWAAVNAAVCTASLNIDPTRPVQTLELTGIKAPSVSDRWQWNERNLHLYDGLCAYSVNASGNVQLDRVITMYRVNKFNVQDTSYLDIETIKTLSYIRYAIRQRITSRFPRHKLANDGTRFGAGQAIVTPSIIRNELLALFTELELKGLVEDFNSYKDSLIVERNADDPNRIDVLSHEDLINQFRIYAHCIQYLL